MKEEGAASRRQDKTVVEPIGLPPVSKKVRSGQVSCLVLSLRLFRRRCRGGGLLEALLAQFGEKGRWFSGAIGTNKRDEVSEIVFK